MALDEHYYTDDIHPIDMVENLAQAQDWDFDRIGDDQIAMAVEGQWRTYSITLAWSGSDDTLRMICSYDVDPPEDKLPKMYHMLNKVNDQCWAGAFSYWEKQKLMVYRYGLLVSGDRGVCPEQIDRLIRSAVTTAERYYPAFQLVVWGNRTPENALQVAIAEAYGHA